jgi:DNA helicase-2/ATP-dependent DNA helicase PcrA
MADLTPTATANAVKQRYLAAKRALFDRAYSHLNAKQREAVYTTKGPLLVLAGAGSGKTTVLVQRMAHIIKYGDAYRSEKVPDELDAAHVAELEAAASLSPEEVEQILPEFICDPCPPYRMLAITFTNKAANQIKSRLAGQFSDAAIAGDIWSGTFHSVCVRILRRDGEKIGYASNFTIYDDDDRKKILSQIIKQMELDTLLKVREVMNIISREKDKLHAPEDTLRTAGVDYKLTTVAKVYQAYAEELRRSNALDFDDIILQTVRLLRECPEVLSFYQRKFRYVCIDEYQDTNEAQFALASLLSGGSGNLMVVGDDDQSIYRFRGATIENILHFDETFKNATVIKLEQNYRSTKTILDAANSVIAHNRGRRGKTLWTSGAAGDKIVLRLAEDQTAESRSIVDTINRCMSGEIPRTDGGRWSYRDFAVLYRANSQSSSVERAFAKSAIPYRMLGGTRFNDRKEIRDAVAYLQLIHNHSDRERLLRIINEPRRKIGDKTLEAVNVIASETGRSLFDVMDHADTYPALGRSVAALKGFANLIHELTRISQTQSLPELFDAVMTKSGYMLMLLEGGEPERERIENLYELKSNMMEYVQKNPEPSLGGFLEENALVADVDKYDESADAVVLMTVHSAKGLEFPVVFLPGMEENIFPSWQTVERGNDEDMEEERRLAYVALTRAKERVYIIHTKSRMLNGQTVINPPLSCFVEEIPAELIQEEDLTQKVPDRPTQPAGWRNTYGEYSRKPRKPQHTDRLTVGRPTPAVNTDERATMQTLRPGDRVRHITFGEGEILSAKPMGSDILFEVMFDTAGTKKLMGTYAKLKRVE